MGKLFRDATGQAILEEMKNQTAAIKGISGSGGTIGGGDGTTLDLPPEDGKLYGMKDKAWTIITNRYSTTDILPPAVEEVNKTGEVSVRFFIPFKYAMSTTRTALSDVAHLGWRFPFAEGRIKKVSVKANVPDTTSLDVLVDGSTVLTTSQTVTNAWKDYSVNTLIRLNQAVELYVTQSFKAEDLEVVLLIEVGNASIEFVGEPDLEPNVYVTGSRAATWGGSGQVMSDGFRTVYMPSVSKLRGLGNGWAAGTDDGKWYVCGRPSTVSSWDLASYLGKDPGDIATPIEYPIEGFEDIIYSCDTSASPSLSLGIFLYPDGTIGTTRDTTPIANYTIKSFNDQWRAGAVPFVTNGNKILYITATKNGQPTVTAVDFADGTAKQVSGQYVLTENSEIYQLPSSPSGSNTKVEHSLGEIKRIWGSYATTLFALTADNTLYAKGSSTTYGFLGLPKGTYSTLTKVGVFDVKEIGNYGGNYIAATFLLTNDGKLYYTGYQNVSDNLPYKGTDLEAFTQVYENYYFHDIAFCNSTLVAIAERLGDMPE